MEEEGNVGSAKLAQLAFDLSIDPEAVAKEVVAWCVAQPAIADVVALGRDTDQCNAIRFIMQVAAAKAFQVTRERFVGCCEAMEEAMEKAG